MVQNIVQKHPWDSETECSDLREDWWFFKKNSRLFFVSFNGFCYS